MSPTEEQIENWMETHKVEIQYFENRTIIIAQQVGGNPIVISTNREATNELLLCDLIAEKLLILKPSIAFKLNGSTQNQPATVSSNEIRPDATSRPGESWLSIGIDSE